jgi:hypothetical protein
VIAVFDMRQKRVLLSLVEPMNFVHEHDASFAFVEPSFLCFRHNHAQIRETAKYSAKGNKLRSRSLGDNATERRLADAWRPPKDHRWNTIGGNRAREKLVCAEEMRLTDVVFESGRTHAFRKRRLGAA